MNKELKKTIKFLKKNRELVLKTIIPVVIFCVTVIIICIFLPKPNDNISPSSNSYLFENRNPTFNVGFGSKDNPEKQYVRFEASLGDNPFEEKEENLWSSFTKSFKSKKGFEFGLSEIRFSETESDSSKELVDRLGNAIAQMELDSISTDTEVIEVGRVLGEEDSDNVSKKTVINKDVYPGIDVEYQILEGLGVKEEIVIRNIDEYTSQCGEDTECLLPLNEFVFDLKLDEGVQIKEAMIPLRGKTENKYYLTDNEGNYIAHFLPTFAIDGVGSKTTDVDLDISNVEGSNYKVTVILNLDWLFSNDRVFPIRIDPSIVHDTTTEFDTGSNYNTEVVTGPKVQLNKPDTASFDTNLEGYWKLDEVSGTGAYLLDSSNSNNGTPTGTTYTNGVYNGARDFDGGDTTGDYISAGTSLTLKPTTALTVSVWVYAKSINSSQGRTVLSTYDYVSSTENYGYNLGAIWTTPSFQFHICDGGTADGIVADAEFFTENMHEWVHMVGVYSASNYIRLYKNGVLVDEQTSGVPSSIVYNGGNFTIGRRALDSQSYWDGGIDEVRVYSSALSSTQVRELYEIGLPTIQGAHTSASLDTEGSSSEIESITWTSVGDNTGDGETPYSTTGLVGQWDFNEVSGTTADNEGSCGASCDGTLTNFSNTTGQDVVAGSGWTSDNRRWGSGAVMFDGSDDYVSIPSTTELRPSNNFSVEAWVNVDELVSGVPGVILNHADDGGGDDGWGIRVQGTGRIAFYALNANGWTNQVVESGIEVRTGEWYHVVGMYDNSTLKVYVNGKLEGSKTASGNVAYALTTDLSVGRRGGTFDPNSLFLDGTVDSLRVYNRVLSPNEILSNYQSGNIEMRYRTSTDGSTWGNWSGTETSVEDFDDDYLYDTSLTGFLSYWPMEEESGTTVEDVGYSNDGTASGTYITDGKFGNGRTFDGVDDYISVPDNSSLQLSAGLTLEMWYKSTELPVDWIIPVRKDTETGTRYLYGFGLDNTSGGRIYGQYYNGTNFIATYSGSDIFDGQWHHAAMTISGTTLKFYFDGAFKESVTISGTQGVPSGELNIGAAPPWTGGGRGHYFEGSIDEVRISNTVATDQEIAERWVEGSSNATSFRSKPIGNYVEGDGAFEFESLGSTVDANTVGYWKLEEGGTLYQDSSPYNNDSTSIVGTTYVKEGVVGSAVDFDGVDDKITVGTSGQTPNNFTVEAWFTTDVTHEIDTESTSGVAGTSGQRYLFGAYNPVTPSTDAGMGVSVGTNGISVYEHGPSYMPPLAVYSGNVPGGWNYLAVVYENKKPFIYLNGELVRIGLTSTKTNVNPPKEIGGGSYGYHSGMVDEVRISNRVRTSEEIMDVYKMGKNEFISKSLSNNFDVSDSRILPFWIASDQLGTNIDFTYGETSYANYESDANTVGLWHMDDNIYAQEAEGGTITYSGGYTIHSFTSSGTFKLNTPADVEYLVIGGGGAGGQNRGSGGGAGGYLTGTLSDMNSGSYTVTVGAGGDSWTSLVGENGGNSVFASVTATGGGGGVPGGTPAGVGVAGGSGSGGTSYYGYDQNIGGSGVSGQGYRGGYATVQAGYTRWCAAGGGGAGSVGQAVVCSTVDAGSKGGVGLASSITGTSITRASGGSGWPQTAKEPGGGGASGQAGTANTGGGGGAGAAGGSGIVIVRYTTPTDTAKDSSGYMYDGSVYGAKSSGESILGDSILFDGVNDYVSVPHNSAISFERTNAFTVEAWVKTSSTATFQEVIAKMNNGAPYRGYDLSVYEGVIHFMLINTWDTNCLVLQGTTTINDGNWHHIVGTYDGSSSASGTKIYIDGKRESVSVYRDNLSATIVQTEPVTIGMRNGQSGSYFDGSIDEVRISNTARSADDIRQAYEIGRRTHPINIDFKASLQSSNLITSSGDKSFTISEEDYGTVNPIEHIDVGEKIVVKENIGGTEYIAQGDIDSVNTSTGAVTVTSWDSGSTFPTSGFTANATVFKWQREYVDIRYPLGEDINGITRLTFRKTTDVPATFWVDDVKKATYSSDYNASSFTPIEGIRYIQYKPIFTKWDSNPNLDLYLTEVDITYTAGPTNEELMRHGKWFNTSGVEQPFWWVDGVSEDTWTLDFSYAGGATPPVVTLVPQVIPEDTNLFFSTTISSGTPDYEVCRDVGVGPLCVSANGATYTGSFSRDDELSLKFWNSPSVNGYMTIREDNSIGRVVDTFTWCVGTALYCSSIL